MSDNSPQIIPWFPIEDPPAVDRRVLVESRVGVHRYVQFGHREHDGSWKTDDGVVLEHAVYWAPVPRREHTVR